MASSFDRWEKDPFFSAAEEVQESADRMESTYRTWIHALKDTSGVWRLDELRRDLQTTLGTSKWQLEEFGRAVRSSYIHNNRSDEDAKDRHQHFIAAMESQIAKVESSLNESAASRGKPPLPWVRLDEGERNELAMFLSGSSSVNRTLGKINGNDQRVENSDDAGRQLMRQCSRSSSHLADLCQVQVEGKEEKTPGHRRTASASADISSWKIVVVDDSSARDLSSVKSDPKPRRIPSFSGLLNTMESSMSQLKWSKNGYKKLKHTEQEADTLPRSQNLAKGVSVCYEKSKSCLDRCDEYYNKHLYGWYGAFQRLLQRSQYYMQYSRPVQVFCSIFLIFCLLGILIRSWFLHSNTTDRVPLLFF